MLKHRILLRIIIISVCVLNIMSLIACSGGNPPEIIQSTHQVDTPWIATEEYISNPIIAVVTAPPPPTPTPTITPAIPGS